MSTVNVLRLAILAFGGLAFAQGERRDRLGDPLPAGAMQRLGNLRMRYPSFPCLAYLPDGRAIVTQGGTLDICDMARGERLSSTRVSDAGVISVQTRSDGKALLIGDSAGKVREWDVER
ncbi:MAG: hypothetical protein FJ278_24465, partial [Planctomycetes bacterium]|nr:hypothetical protein [Planctomycetota bacterium]